MIGPTKWKRRSYWLIGGTIAASTLLWIPLPTRLVSSKSMSCELEKTYMECCLKLSDETSQDRLLQPTGVPVSVRKKTNGKGAVPSQNPLGNAWSGLSGSFSTTETLKVEGDSEIGPLDLELQKETTLGLDTLQVHTYSVDPRNKLERYSHRFTLSSERRGARAQVTIEIQLRLPIPWFYRTIAGKRLDRAVEQQADGFLSRLKTALNQ